MLTPLDQAKAALREQVRVRSRQISPTARADQSQLLITRIQALAGWQQALCVLLYAPLPDEVDIWPLLQLGLEAGKQVALPSFVPETGRYIAKRITHLEREIVTGRFGIREPVASAEEISLNQLDLTLVPGVAFDARGRRLGRGKGFYDQLLPAVRGPKWGIAFDEQLVEAVPVGPHDVTLNCMLTPTRWIET